ncbi:hypothetical protein CW304_28760 [Bacillus sp. UFRGS-B20]|nr:hypothetical protein CW304_28760 [Bacillus sp. UFRGS-B20]
MKKSNRTVHARSSHVIREVALLYTSTTLFPSVLFNSVFCASQANFLFSNRYLRVWSLLFRRMCFSSHNRCVISCNLHGVYANDMAQSLPVYHASLPYFRYCRTCL